MSATYQNPGDFRGSLINQGSTVDNRGGHMIGTQINVSAGNAELYAPIAATAVAQDRLVLARTLLESLPLDALPEPAALPPGSLMQIRRNDLFVGRAADLLALARSIKSGGTAAVTGLGGLGKTQLAAELVHRYGRFFAGGVFWLSFADAASVPSEVTRCGGPSGMALPDFADLKQPEQIALVLSAWCSALPRLLVFDNCEDPALLERWRPPHGGCRVLLTSRRASWPASTGVASRALGILAPSEGLALLRKHRPDAAADDASLAVIAGELGHLPLALHLAGSYLERYRYDPEGEPKTYLAALRRPDLLAHVSLIGGAASPTGHDLHVANSFALSFTKLDAAQPMDALARRLLQHGACFAPGAPIPRALLRLTLGSEPAGPAVSDAIGRCLDLGLLELHEDGALTLHRLLAAFVCSEAGDDSVSAARDTVEATVAEEAGRLNSAGYPAPLAAWLVHLRVIAEAAAERRSSMATSLFNELGYHLQTRADLPGARTAFERALRINVAVFGPDHPAVATDMNNLGSVLRDLGDLRCARAAFERALRIAEAAFGPEHPEVARVVNNFGLVLRDVGDLPGARAAYERALRIDEATFGPDHPKIATAQNNLGSVLRALGELVAARAAYERALRIDEAAFGPNHPEVATDVNNLGTVLRALGDLAGARANIERALRIDEAAFGPDHPNVATDVNNLGRVLQDLGDLPAARAAFERALRIDEAAFGSDHPKIANRANNLGRVQRALGDLPAARAAFERALAIFTAHLPPGHASIRTVQDNIAALETG
jgi:tetratricopeptide (TPR) repeat protein